MQKMSTFGHMALCLSSCCVLYFYQNSSNSTFKRHRTVQFGNLTEHSNLTPITRTPDFNSTHVTVSTRTGYQHQEHGAQNFACDEESCDPCQRSQTRISTNKSCLCMGTVPMHSIQSDRSFLPKSKRFAIWCTLL